MLSIHYFLSLVYHKTSTSMVSKKFVSFVVIALLSVIDLSSVKACRSWQVYPINAYPVVGGYYPVWGGISPYNIYYRNLMQSVQNAQTKPVLEVATAETTIKSNKNIRVSEDARSDDLTNKM